MFFTKISLETISGGKDHLYFKLNSEDLHNAHEEAGYIFDDYMTTYLENLSEFADEDDLDYIDDQSSYIVQKFDEEIHKNIIFAN